MVISELRDLAIRHWVKSWMKRPPGEMLAFVMDPELICHAWDWVSRAGEKPSSVNPPSCSVNKFSSVLVECCKYIASEASASMH